MLCISRMCVSFLPFRAKALHSFLLSHTFLFSSRATRISEKKVAVFNFILISRQIKMGNIQSKLAARANHAEPIEMTHRSSGSADASAVDHIEASAQQASAKEANAGSIEVIPVAVEDVEAGPHTGESKKLIGRKQFTVLLTVEAIALGTLGVPRAFADLGMIGGVILTPLFGLISLYTAKLVGQVSLLLRTLYI